MERLPAFAEPWNEYTLEEARREFPPPTHPICGVLQTPVEDVRGRGGLGVGGVGKGSGRTRRPLATIRSLPRDARLLWHHQVAKPCPQADTLRWLRQSQKGEVHESVDLRNQVGDTTILGWPACSDGPWRRRGGALTLPMLFLRFGSLFSAQELLFYYLNCPKVFRTRDHSCGSREAKAAARARLLEWGHRGHRSRCKGK